MLVLTRKQQEKICIGDEIVITVLRLKGKSVRVGIEAPDRVCVLRGELVFDASAGKELVSKPEKPTETDLKQEKTDTGQANTTERVALPQTNVCHLQIPREGCQQVMASLQNGRGPLLANRTSTV
jgi:carbon storage regulator CsrA